MQRIVQVILIINSKTKKRTIIAKIRQKRVNSKISSRIKKTCFKFLKKKIGFLP